MDNNKKHICPICGYDMCWNGTVSQAREIKGCAIVYHYHCTNYKCRYECTFDALDDNTIEIHNRGYGW